MVLPISISTIYTVLIQKKVDGVWSRQKELYRNQEDDKFA